MSLSLNKNSVGWGCKVEALKDMGLSNTDYDELVNTVSGIEHEVEIDYRDYGFEEAHVIGHGNSDGYKSGGYKIETKDSPHFLYMKSKNIWLNRFK